MYTRKHINEDELEEVFFEAAKLLIEKKKRRGVPIQDTIWKLKRHTVNILMEEKYMRKAIHKV